MTSKTSTRGDLPPIDWRPDPIPSPEVQEVSWEQWDAAVAALDTKEQQ